MDAGVGAVKSTLLKHACVDSGQYGLNISAADYTESGIRLLRTTDLGKGSIDDAGVNIAGPLEARFLLQDGDLLLSRSGTIGQATLVTSGHEGSSFAGYLVRFRPTKSTDPRFLFYATQTQQFQEQVASEAVVSTIANFNADRYANVKIPLPDVTEQGRIADFLDDQVARIDNIIAKRHSQTALARDLARAEIVESYFESGREAISLAYVAEVDHGRQRSPENATGPHMIRYVRSANVTDGRIDMNDLLEMNFSPTEQLRYGLNLGDVLVTEASGSPGSIGASAVWRHESADAICFQNHLLRLRARPRLLNADYLGWWARASFYSGAMRVWATGANILNLGSEAIRRMPIPIRTLPNQFSIARYADRLQAASDVAISSLRRESELVAELKRSLITAAVTGDFDVSAANGSQILAGVSS